MDAPRFDSLTQAVGMSRRGTLKRLLGSAFAAAFLGWGGNNAAAACKKVGQNCDRDNDCCTGAKCQNGNCRCKNGRNECGGKCFDRDVDEKHCGACNNACAADETCCGGECVDLQSSRDNCASCGAACAANEICAEGQCVPCPDGNQLCGEICCAPFRECCDGVCVDDLSFNPDHCGACGNRCPGICTQVDGVLQCHGPRCCDDNQCVDDLQSDRKNCGACGTI